MFASYVLSFREILEIGLLVSLIFMYLSRANMNALMRYVWFGIASGMAVSVALGTAIWAFFGELSEEYATIFEASVSFLAAVVLTLILFWLAKHRGDIFKQKLQKHVDAFTEKEAVGGIFLFSFLVVVREGIEVVLFLLSFIIANPVGAIFGASFGATTAIMLSFALFRFGKHIDIKKIFYWSSLLIVLIVSGMLGAGTHELIEYLALHGHNLGMFSQFAYNLNIPDESVWSQKGIFGAPLAIFFGYSSKMEWGRLLAQLFYLAIFVPLTIQVYRKK